MSVEFRARPYVDPWINCFPWWPTEYYHSPICSCSCSCGKSCSCEKAPEEPQEPVLAEVIQERPLVGVCLCIRREGSVLLHKRLGNHAPNTWAFPGGHLEKMETFQTAVIREMHEEAGTDLVVSAPKLWTVANTRFFDEDKHYVVVFMVSDWISGKAKVMEPDKCECWHWFRWNERDLPAPLMKGIQMLVNIKEDPFKV